MKKTSKYYGATLHLLFIWIMILPFYSIAELLGISALKSSMFVTAILFTVAASALGCDERFNHLDVSKRAIEILGKQKLFIWFSDISNASKVSLVLVLLVLVVYFLTWLFCLQFCSKDTIMFLENRAGALPIFIHSTQIFMMLSAYFFGVGRFICKLRADKTKRTLQGFQLSLFIYACVLFILERFI